MALTDQPTIERDVEYQFHFFGEAYRAEDRTRRGATGRTYTRVPVFLTDLRTGEDVHASVGVMAARMIQEATYHFAWDEPLILVKHGEGLDTKFDLYSALEK